MSVWVDRVIVGDRPPQRGGHATAAVLSSSGVLGLVVIGGADAFGIAYNDVYLLREEETETNTKEEVGGDKEKEKGEARRGPLRCIAVQTNASSSSSSSSPFTARMGHSAHGLSHDLSSRLLAVSPSFSASASVVELADDGSPCAPPPPNNNNSAAPPSSLSDAIVVFGGMNPATESIHNTVWVCRVDFNIDKENTANNNNSVPASVARLNPPRKGVIWEELCGCSGEVPPPRHSHGSAIIADELVVVGGSDGNQPLDDGYALNLVTRVWRRLDLSYSSAPPTYGSASASASSPPIASSSNAIQSSSALLSSAGRSVLCAREMTSLAVHPRSGAAVLAGGRDSDGLMLGDGFVLAAATQPPSVSAREGPSDPKLLHVSKLFEDSKQRRCCHTVVPTIHSKLGQSVFLCVGGFTPDGMPQEDVVFGLAEGSASPSLRMAPITVPRKLQRKPNDELHFGLGHSSSVVSWKWDTNQSTPTTTASVAPPTAVAMRCFVVAGIIPNTISPLLSVYELVLDGAAASAPLGNNPQANEVAAATDTLTTKREAGKEESTKAGGAEVVLEVCGSKVSGEC